MNYSMASTAEILAGLLFTVVLFWAIDLVWLATNHRPTGNRRSFPRYPVCCPVTYTIAGVEYAGRICDMSREGWRVEGPCPGQPGASMALALTLDAAQPPATAARATVRWVRDGSFGIRLEDVEPQSAHRLSDFVADLARRQPPLPLPQAA
jgi:hypothetical protein